MDQKAGNNVLEFRHYNKNAQGKAHCIAVTQEGEQLAFLANSITALRAQMGEYKKMNGYRGVPVKTLLQESYTGSETVFESNSNTGSSNPATFPRNPTFDVNKRFDMTTSVLQMMLRGSQESVLICGRGGSGKTYTLLKVLETEGLSKIDLTCSPAVEVKQFLLVKGCTSPQELFKILHDYQNCIVVFDDCDDVFDDERPANILKSALDRETGHFISWSSPLLKKQGYPPVFSFRGKIVFISNRKMHCIPQPIKSRALCLDLDYTDEELIERAEKIQKELLQRIDETDRKKILDFVTEKHTQFKDFSLRTYTQAEEFFVDARKTGDFSLWKDLTLFTA